MVKLETSSCGAARELHGTVAMSKIPHAKQEWLDFLFSLGVFYCWSRR